MEIDERKKSCKNETLILNRNRNEKRKERNDVIKMKRERERERDINRRLCQKGKMA